MHGVSGYSIGGKTGTSEDGVNTGKYVTSFLGVAPINDPEIVILVTLYNPTGEGGHTGGAVAAPVGGQVLAEVLPYLEVEKIRNIEYSIHFMSWNNTDEFYICRGIINNGFILFISGSVFTKRKTTRPNKDFVRISFRYFNII